MGSTAGSLIDSSYLLIAQCYFGCDFELRHVYNRRMNKQKLVQQIIAQLESDLLTLKSAAQASYEAATGEESRPENEYDTRALEASYLAGAQAKRVSEVESLLTVLKYLEIKSFNAHSPIGASALVDLDNVGKKLCVFLIPAKGSITINFESKSIQVITIQSPLGEALVGLKVGDFAIVDRPQETLEYEVLGVT